MLPYVLCFQPAQSAKCKHSRGSSARDLTFDLWRVGVVVSERVHLPFSPLSLEAAHRLLLLTPLETSFLTTF